MRNRRAFVVWLALAIDWLLGDPPNRFHPVAWMGRAIGSAERFSLRGGRLGALISGLLIAASGARVVAGLGVRLEELFSRLPTPAGLLLEAGVLKTTFSLRGLADAAGQVRVALADGDLPEARRLLFWHLVSRETDDLDEAQVAAATIESVAENTSDGVVAPLLYYAIGGLPAAVAYRFLNTVDSMLGYRDERYEWLGKGPARLDDAASFVPSRLTAALLVLAAMVGAGDGPRAWRVLRREGSHTESPNAGRPMAAMAGALGVELEKVGHYRLGEGLPRPVPEDIARAVRLTRLVAVGAAALLRLL
jgi:adenosylcobinamide-phosphate synthase